MPAQVKAFNDGVCSIYTVEKKSIKEKIGDFNFEEETIGIRSFYELHAVGITIEKVISIPFNKLIDHSHVIKIEDSYYDISLIQRKDTFPKSLRISINKSIVKWNDGGIK